MSASNPPTVVRSLAPAKLNLHLELLGRRDDGFHELETVMTAINRFDRIELSVSSDDAVHVDCRWSPGLVAKHEHLVSDAFQMPKPADNLVSRALDAFRQQFPVALGFQVRIHKSIPSAAGMGGASSDAAAVLQAAAKLHNIDQHDRRLIQIAADLGSDIPFFFGTSEAHRTSAAVATGRGEVIRPVPLGAPIHFVVCQPREGLSTAAVYRACEVPKEPASANSLLASMAAGDIVGVAKQLVNRLHQPAQGISQGIARVLLAMRRTNIIACQMTGSGSACFGVCRSAVSAKRIARQLQSAGLGIAFAATSVFLPNRQWAFGNPS